MKAGCRLAMRSAVLVSLAVVSSSTRAETPAPPPAGAEWRHWGGTAGGVRFSPLDQIRRDNVARLAPAWTYDTGELKLGRGVPSFKANFATTPLAVNGLLYLSTPSSRVIALDPETGREVWAFDPQAGRAQREFNSHRGVAYWESASGQGPCQRRIVGGTVDGRLFALDAGSGAPCADFGRDGYVDLRAEDGNHWIEKPSFGGLRITAPPALYKDIVITGCAQEEYPGRGPSGDVRAYDVRSGRMLWRFHVVPHPGEVGHETWEGDSWKDRMGANVWSMLSVDVERGMVFLPTGSPASDFYGGDRKGDDLFGNSLVALDAATGKRLWHFQMVHHDLWDYDLPAQPVLVNVRRDGRDIPAVVQVTKLGFVYVLDRLTGTPLFPVEERPVAKSEIPGERTAATQPFPLKPPPLSRQQALTRDDLSHVTPESRAYCEKLFDSAVSGGIFTPLSTKATIFFPGLHGGGNWGGGAYDPSSGLLYVGANEVAGFGYLRALPPSAPLPYGLATVLPDVWFADTNGWPCQQPPWGTLNAVDVSTGDIRWRVPLGSVEELEAKGLPRTGRQSLGGAIVTAGGLVFIGATIDKRFRAFDAATGAELWSFALPANAHANPMTFRGKSGRQFVVIAAGGGGFWRDLSRELSDSLIAFALP